MRERTVGISHLVRVFALLDGATTVVGCIEKLAGQAIDHRRFIALASGSDQPANCEGLATLRTNIYRNLVRSTTNAARTDFDVRSDVIKSGVENDQRLLLGSALYGVERTIDNAFSDGLLAVE